MSHEEYWIPNLWRSFQDCQFVEDEGEVLVVAKFLFLMFIAPIGQILFYKDKNGEALYDVTE